MEFMSEVDVHKSLFLSNIYIILNLVMYKISESN